MMGIVQNFAAIGLTLQNGTFNSNFSSGANAYSMVVIIMLFVFYFVAIYFAFIAYREFKGMLYDANGSG
jgi:hypothetical protein